MPNPNVVHDAAEVQRLLRERLGHAQIHVKPYGQHLLIQMEDAGELDTVARITRFDAKTYGAAFRSHSGRWEPLPDEGTREEMLDLVVSEFGPYLVQENY